MTRKEVMKDAGKNTLLALVSSGQIQQFLDKKMIRGGTLSNIADCIEVTGKREDGKYEIIVTEKRLAKPVRLWVDGSIYLRLSGCVRGKDGTVKMSVLQNQRLFYNEMKALIDYMSKEYDLWAAIAVDSALKLDQLECRLKEEEAKQTPSKQRIRRIKLKITQQSGRIHARAERFDEKFDRILEKYGDLDKILADIRTSEVLEQNNMDDLLGECADQ